MTQKQKTRVVYATGNPGKLAEALEFAKANGVELLSLDDLNINLEVEESGTSYEANASLKANAYAKAINDSSIIVIADDGGIEIPTLDNKPGVYSRRWKGYEMTDQEIVDYCLEQLKGAKGKQRDAIFVTVLAVKIGNQPIKYFKGKMHCHIVEKPLDTKIVKGFPFVPYCIFQN